MPSTATKTNCSRAKSATTIWQQHQFIAAAAKATKAGTFEEGKANAREASSNPDEIAAEIRTINPLNFSQRSQSVDSVNRLGGGGGPQSQYGGQPAFGRDSNAGGGIMRSASSHEIPKLYQTRDCLGRIVCEWLVLSFMSIYGMPKIIFNK
jgi:hypothetical protein